jgi:tetratricopeptide (TPR) repeat protein
LEEGQASPSHVPEKAAYDYFVRGRASVHPPSLANIREARVYFNRALELDPKFAGGYAGLAFTTALEIFLGRISNGEFELPPDSELDQADKAIAIDPSFGWAYVPLGWKHLLRGNHDDAVKALSRGLEVSPGEAELNAYMCYMLLLQRRGDEACKYAEIARKLDPLHATYRLYHAYAKFVAGAYGEAIDLIENHVPVDRYSPMSFVFLIASYIRQSEHEKAKSAAELALAKFPFMSFESLEFFIPYAYEDDRLALMDDLATALRLE